VANGKCEPLRDGETSVFSSVASPRHFDILDRDFKVF